MDLFEFAQKKKEERKKEVEGPSKPDAKPTSKPPYQMDDASVPQPPEKPQEKQVLTVSQLSNQLRMVIEGRFGAISVEGEISGLKRAASGHVYFDLKDKDNLIKCIMWRSSAERLKVALEDGAQVIIHGKVTTYGARSNYQITVNRVEMAGIGALMQKFEHMKAQLAAEGLFDESRKKAIPYLPEKIGIITSPTGAVIEDMLHRIEDRFPRHVQLYPVLVQGVGAKEQIADAVTYFNNLPKHQQPDVLIVARGGGSLEDLWAFNEEIVVRSIATCTIPVISAVGHEPDVTLCDFVADLRAPTPTAAAEMVVPVRSDLIYTVSLYESKLQRAMVGQLQMLRKHVALMKKGLPDPQSTLNQMRMRMEDRRERLSLAINSRMVRCSERLSMTSRRLNVDILYRQIQIRKDLLNRQHKLLESYSPNGPLKRGYVYMTNEQGELLRSKNQGEAGDQFVAHFADGTRKVTLGEQ